MTKFTQTYPADPKYTEWQEIAKFFPRFDTEHPPKWERWQIINAILYVNRTGHQWRMLSALVFLRITDHHEGVSTNLVNLPSLLGSNKTRVHRNNGR
jgi:hypothetical protein